MKQPSLLEWILIGVMGLIVLIYCVLSIYKMIDRKKHPEKYLKKKEEERKQLDE